MPHYQQRWVDVHAIEHAVQTGEHQVTITLATHEAMVELLAGLCTGRELHSGALVHDHACPIHPDV